MKRNRLLLVLAIVVVLTMVLASCKCTHEEYTDWTITKDPTATATGTAERKCVKCGEPETKTIAALGDTSVWTKSATESVAPTHSTAGKDVYTSEYGTVTVPLDPIDHTFDQEVAEAKFLKEPATCTTVAVYYKSCSCGVASTTLTFEHGNVLGHDVGEGAITVTTEPTLDAAGTATFTCVRENCPATDHLATVTLEQLSDTSAWTVVNTPADYEHPETTTYTHKVYTSVVITKTNGSPLALPYAGKSYAVIEVETGSTNGVKISGGNIVATVSANATTITGPGYPVNGTKNITSFNAQNSTLLVDGIAAWVDKETGLIVRLRSANDYDDFYLFIPVTGVTNASEVADRTAAVNAAKDKVSASQWNGNFAVTYTADATPYGIFVTSDSVTLGVTFTDDTGAPLAASACKTSEHGVVVSKGETLVAAFETVDSALVKYSRYTNGSDTLKIYTDSTFAIGAKKGTFTVNSNDTLDAYVLADGKKVEHYTITLSDDGTYTLADVKAEITFVVGEGGTLEQTVQSLYVGCVITAVPTVNSPETTAFVGWYTDLEDDETLVTFVPAAAATLYAKYSTLVTYHVVDAFGGNKDVKVIEGQVIMNCLPNYTDATINSANNTYFAGWQYPTADGKTVILASNDVAGVADSGMTLTALWAPAGRWVVEDTTSNYTFVYNSEQLAWISNNKGLNSTTATMYIVAKEGPVFISFDYVISSENSDKLKVYLYESHNGNNTIPVNKGGENVTGSYKVKLLAGQELKINYEKDSSVNKGEDIVKISNLIINGREITKAGEYDMKEGTYTCAGKSDLELDGYGTFALGELKGTYTVDSTDRSKLTATVIDTNGKAVGQYNITLDGTTYTAEAGKVTVTYHYGTLYYANVDKLGSAEEKSHIAFEVVTLPTEGEFLTKVKDGVTYVFIGWYDGYRTDSNKLTTITPSAAMDVYARYVDASTLVTVTYNHNVAGADDKTVRVEKDKAVGELYVPTVTNGDKVFVGWFTKDGTDGDYGDEVTSASVFSEDVTVYAKWVTPNPMQGIYKGFTFAQYCITNEVIVVNIDAEGNAAVTVGSAAGINGSVIEKQSADNVYRFVSGTSYYYAYFDGETLSVSTDSNQDFFGDYVNVFAKVDSADVEMMAVSNYMYPISWRDDETGLNRIGIVSVQVGSGAEEQIYYVINTHAAKVALTVVDANGQAVTSESAYNTYGNVITITNDNGVNVTKVYNGTTWVDFDSYKGSYTDDTWGPFTIDGIKRVIIGSHSYEYTIVSDGVISVTINNRYYEISNMSAPTCTVTPYNTTVTFVIANGTVEGVNDDGQFVYGINTQITLPTPAMDKGYGFFGWYDNAEYTGNAVTTVTFDKATSAKTYYAKVEEVPAWSSMSTAEELKFEDNSATFTGETTAANKTAYAKFVVDQDGNYYLYGTASKVGGDGNFSYARYTVISENGEAVLKSVCSYSSNTALGPYSLSAGTYFLQTHLGGNIVGNGSNNQDVYGTFSIQIVRALHTTADTAIEYTVGTEVTAIIQSVGEKTLVTVYKVELDVNKSYALTYTPTSNSRLTIVPDPTKTTTNTVANTYWTSAAKTVDLSFGSQQSGTYYIVVDNAGSKFVINEKVVSEDISFAGQTYRYSADNYNIRETETWEITFTTETTGTIITNTEVQYQLYEQTYDFTDVKVDAAAKTITFVTTKKSEVTATYSADGKTITFDSSCGISECNGKALSKQA